VDRPRNYPEEFERSLTLADGRVVRVRPIVPRDASDLAAAISSADSETLHRRFLGGAPPTSPDSLARLVTVDYSSRFALTAWSGSHGVAIARYEQLETGPDQVVTAEVAVAVDPAWRRIGLATALVQLLAERAAACGIRRLTATYFANNEPIVQLGLFSHAHTCVQDGVAELSVSTCPRRST
jgi:GNAT superfamily N-acetyltransferase